MRIKWLFTYFWLSLAVELGKIKSSFITDYVIQFMSKLYSYYLGAYIANKMF